LGCRRPGGFLLAAAPYSATSTTAEAVLEPPVRIIYERGAFVAADTTATAVILGAFATGLFAFIGMRIVTPAFPL
jgi:putative peptidoglycan lipid II flippase